MASRGGGSGGPVPSDLVNHADGHPVATPSIAIEAVAALKLAEPQLASDPAAIRVVVAPGRVNLIGEHTDYNDGLRAPRGDQPGHRDRLRADVGSPVEADPGGDRRTAVVDLDDIAERRGTWIDYVAGTAWALAEAGQPLTGFRGVLAADLPSGARTLVLRRAGAGHGLGPAAAQRPRRWSRSPWRRSPGAPRTPTSGCSRGSWTSSPPPAGSPARRSSWTAGRSNTGRCRSRPDLRLVVCHSGVTHRHDARRVQRPPRRVRPGAGGALGARGPAPSCPTRRRCRHAPAPRPAPRPGGAPPRGTHRRRECAGPRHRNRAAGR